ncbi:MAG: methyl-accepting chemotaxis protein [Myxococcota bacterium]
MIESPEAHPTELEPLARGWRQVVDLAYPVPIALAVTVFATLLFEASLAEFGAMFVGYAAPILVGCALLRRRASEWALPAIPAQVHRTLLVAGLSSIVLVPSALSVVGAAGWFAPALLRSLALFAVVNAVASAQVCFYHARIRLGRYRRSAGPEEVSLTDAFGGSRTASRLRLAVALPAVAGMLVVFDVAGHLSLQRAANERIAFAEAAISALGGAEGTFAERVASVLPAEAFRPGRVVAFPLDAETLGGDATAHVPDPFLTAVDAALASGRTDGAIRLRDGSGVGRFETGPEGRSFAVFVGTAETANAWTGGLWLVFAASVLVFAFGMRVGGDVERSIAHVRAHADRLAAGDLRGEGISVMDDDLGALEASLVRAAESFRTTLGAARSAAEGVESTLAELGGALGGIVESSNVQAAQVDEIHAFVTSISNRVGEAQGSASALTTAIDESSNSVLELGAAGDELNETASVLTSKVDAVSDSLEQMVRSVKEVGATTDRLAEASEETSSSMEEMASAMRAVDTAAETTANLSRDVVEKAELGQAKVVQTIAGMEAIREATDAAESVIRGLGARTNEIGGILDVIDDVADETNLLALNAAIIAAQAGEQGKAFSVVADEIKELADRVLASTKEIGGLIRAVQEESENAIGAIEAGSASVMGGVDLSAEAGKTLEEITDASREAGTRISEIVTSVREQTKAASHVVALMEKVRESADQIGEASNEQNRGNEIVYRSALTMREVAQQVRRTTEDQAAGFGRIRENVTGVRGAVEQISGSLGDQSAVCEQVASVLDSVADGSRSNEEAARRVRDAMTTLVDQAQELRGNVERFRC